MQQFYRSKLMIRLSFPLLTMVFIHSPMQQAQAEITPVSIAIVSPVQFPNSEYSITGVRLSALWGHHRDVYGLDFGAIGNITDQDFYGIGVAGVFNKTSGTTFITGLQLAGITNINTSKTKVVGIQAALGANVNSTSSSVAGLQFSMANLSKHTDIYGVQLGVFNQARAVYGFQIGIINMATNLHGIQIGLLNFNSDGLFKVSPILNIGF